jgi:hypothetical protein
MIIAQRIDGSYLAVGTSLFWALRAFQHDRERLKRHLDCLSSRGISYDGPFSLFSRLAAVLIGRRR